MGDSSSQCLWPCVLGIVFAVLTVVGFLLFQTVAMILYCREQMLESYGPTEETHILSPDEEARGFNRPEYEVHILNPDADELRSSPEVMRGITEAWGVD